MAKTAVIFEAHSDDSAVGIGATIVKLAKENHDIIKVIFSAGQRSHPHFREDVIIKRRIKETENIGRRFGIKQNIFLGLRDNSLKEEIINKDVHERVRRIIKKYKPLKIFSTSSSDPHPDHRAVNNLIMNVIRDLEYKGEMYSYEVWNILNENNPVVYIDISKLLKVKIAMMKSFKSQWYFMYPLLIPVVFRAFLYGMRANCKYAEKLYKLR
jgi:LmbE family N-acetylglucosaminyl deacetylase